MLQEDLASTYPILDVQIVGINEFGEDPPGANDLATQDRTTPWLQDVDSDSDQASDVWHDWDATWRDVVILNGQNETVDVYNLTANNLQLVANYATMRDKLIDAAMAEQKPWQNQRDRYDINDDGFVVPGDVLIMINDIDDNGPRELMPPTTDALASPYWDSNGDNYFSPVDILQVINFIDETHAEGEASGEPGMGLATVNAALPVPASQSPASATLSDIQIVDASLNLTTTPVPSSTASQIAPIADDRSQFHEPAGDDFWADYWPSL